MIPLEAGRTLRHWCWATELTEIHVCADELQVVLYQHHVRVLILKEGVEERQEHHLRELWCRKSPGSGLGCHRRGPQHGCIDCQEPMFP